MRRVAFGAGQHRLNGFAALDRKQGDKEKGEVVYPSHFFEDLATAAFRTIFFSLQAPVHLDLAGLGPKDDEHEG
jgi:hypothetical protein